MLKDPKTIIQKWLGIWYHPSGEALFLKGLQEALADKGLLACLLHCGRGSWSSSHLHSQCLAQNLTHAQ